MAVGIGEPVGTEFLLSHSREEEEFLKSVGSGLLHHAWLLSGPMGVGKATFARRAARYLFSHGAPGIFSRLNVAIDTSSPVVADEAVPYDDDEGEDPPSAFEPAAAPEARSKGASSLAAFDKSPMRMSSSHPLFARMAAGGMPDFKVVEREYFDAARTRRKSDISVEQVRGLKEFFSTTASEEGYKIALIDSVDELNGHSAGALLKILEEPPASAVLFIVCHNPEALLPTIRSRCRMLKFSPISDVDMHRLLSAYAPAMEKDAVEKLVAISGGSIGAALGLYAGGGLDMLEALAAAVPEILAGNNSRMLDVVNQAAASPEKFAMFRAMAMRIVDGAVRVASGLPVVPASKGEGAAMAALAGTRAPEALFRLHDCIVEGFARADGLNLDLAAAAFSMFERMKNAC